MGRGAFPGREVGCVVWADGLAALDGPAVRVGWPASDRCGADRPSEALLGRPPRRPNGGTSDEGASRPIASGPAVAGGVSHASSEGVANKGGDSPERARASAEASAIDGSAAVTRPAADMADVFAVKKRGLVGGDPDGCALTMRSVERLIPTRADGQVINAVGRSPFANSAINDALAKT